MALSDMLNRRIKVSRDEDDSEELSEPSSESSRSEPGPEGVEDSDSEALEDESSDASGPESAEIGSSLTQISFGALAKAQASLSGGTKRKRDEAEEKPSPLDDIRERIRATREERNSKGSAAKDRVPLAGRSSKHAPAVQSSKHAVSRRRIVVDPGATGSQARDPRFDSVVLSRGASDPRISGNAQAAAAKNYAFLSDYRATELASLKQQLAKSKNPQEQTELKRTIRSMADKIRTFERKQREKEVVSQHRKKERELIREGKKSAPYFLKKGEVKKEVLKRRYEEMGAKQRQKSIEKRRKKLASKERKDMPSARRTAQE